MEDLLAGMPLLQPLTPEQRQTLLDRVERREVRRGEVVFREGDDGEHVFLVLDGKMKISRSGGSGDRENLLAVLGPGDVFGELSLFDPGPRTATATALADSQLAALTHAQLMTWLERQPQAAQVLLQLLAHRLRRTNDTMVDLIFTDVPGRVAKALLDLGERFGAPAGATQERAVRHGLTQEELAQLVGASRETVNKALADFAARGWIRLGSRSLVILDPERLGRRAR